MQLRTILGNHDVHSMANCAELLVGDFLGNRVSVDQVQAFEDFATSVLTVNNLELHLETLTRAVLGRLHLGLVHDNLVPSGRYGILLALIGSNGASIKIELCHFWKFPIAKNRAFDREPLARFLLGF
jgi:hypothetical protein